MGQFVAWGGSWPEALAVGGLTGTTTGFVYSFHRVVKVRRAPEEMDPDRRTFLREHGLALLAVWACAGLAALCTFIAQAPSLMASLLQPTVLLLAGLGAVFTLAYAILPWKSNSRPGKPGAGREWPGLKLPWIALSWAALSVGLPAHLMHVEPSVWGLAFAGQTAFVAGITLPFDVRDAHLDPPNMFTLPQFMGNSGAVRLGLALIALSAAVFLWSDAFHGRWAVSVVAMLPVAFGSIPRRAAYYDILLDGLLTLQGASLLLCAAFGPEIMSWAAISSDLCIAETASLR